MKNIASRTTCASRTFPEPVEGERNRHESRLHSQSYRHISCLVPSVFGLLPRSSHCDSVRSSALHDRHDYLNSHGSRHRWVIDGLPLHAC